MAVRVLVAIPTAAYRRGLAVALREAGFEVVEAPDLAAPASPPAPDAVVTSMALLTGLGPGHATGDGPVVVALVEQRDADRVAVAVRAGAAAVVEWDAPPELVVAALDAARQGHSIVPRWAAATFAGRIPAPPPEGRTVSGEEQQWLRLLADGATVAALADVVGYSEREMFRNLHDLYTRIGVRNRTEALLWAERHGMLGPREA